MFAKASEQSKVSLSDLTPNITIHFNAASGVFDYITANGSALPIFNNFQPENLNGGMLHTLTKWFKPVPDPEEFTLLAELEPGFALAGLTADADGTTQALSRDEL